MGQLNQAKLAFKWHERSKSCPKKVKQKRKILQFLIKLVTNKLRIKTFRLNMSYYKTVINFGKNFIGLENGKQH